MASQWPHRRSPWGDLIFLSVCLAAFLPRSFLPHWLLGPKFLFVGFFNFYLFIYLFLAVLGLCFCARAFSSCSKRGPLFIAVRGPLTVAALLVAEHRLQTRRLSSCCSRAQLLRGMWDLPRPGLEPVSPASAGRLSTTAPPGKPRDPSFLTLCLKDHSPQSSMAPFSLRLALRPFLSHSPQPVPLA